MQPCWYEGRGRRSSARILDRAEADCREALSLLEQADDASPLKRPALVEAYTWLGEILRESGDYAEAIDVLDMALSIDDANAFARGTRGQALAASGHQDEAISELSRAVAQDSGLVWARIDLGELLRLKGDFTAALEQLDHAVEDTDSSAYALATRGQVLRQLDRHAAATADLCEAVKLDKAPWMIAELRAIVSDVTRDLPVLHDVLVKLRRAANGPPEVVPLLPVLADAFRAERQTGKALSALERYLNYVPDDEAALLGRAEVLADLGRAEEALAVCDEIVARSESEPLLVKVVRVRALSALNRRADALAVIDNVPSGTWALEWFTTVKAGILADYRQFDEALALLDSLTLTADDVFASLSPRLLPAADEPRRPCGAVPRGRSSARAPGTQLRIGTRGCTCSDRSRRRSESHLSSGGRARGSSRLAGCVIALRFGVVPVQDRSG